jgi:hypothetical protein
MNILNKQLKSKTVGIVMISASLLLLLVIGAIAVVLFSFGYATGIGLVALVPLTLISIVLLVIAGLGAFIGRKYLRNEGYKKNENLGNIVIAVGLVYLALSLISYLFSQLTGNYGGELRPILAFIWAMVTTPFGLVLRNGCSDD